GRWLDAQFTSIVTSPLVMIGARCEMPVQPVSRMLSGALASPEKVTWPGHAQVHVGLQAKSALVPEPVAQVTPALRSQSSDGGLKIPSPQTGVEVGVGDGVPVRVAVGVAVRVAVTVAVRVGVGVRVLVGVGVFVGVGVRVDVTVGV